MSWTQFSDSASLPMSKNKRDELRERLERLDMSRLTPSDRNHAEKLLRVLSEEREHSDTMESVFASPYIIVVCILVVVSILYFRRNSTVRYPDSSQLRDARSQKYL
jgi:hypothetical protein